MLPGMYMCTRYHMHMHIVIPGTWYTPGSYINLVAIIRTGTVPRFSQADISDVLNLSGVTYHMNFTNSNQK